MPLPYIHVVVELNVLPDKAEETFQLGQALAAEAEKEDGNIYYSFVKAKESADKKNDDYYIIEKYVDEAAVEFHSQTPHIINMVPEIVAKGASIKSLKHAVELGTGERQKPHAAVDPDGKALRLVATLAVTDDKEFVEVAQKYIEASREEDGCLGFTFAKVKESIENEYFFIELWANEGALAAHEVASKQSPLRPALTACSTLKQVIMAYVKA
jgi:quinol monooxygenase YgiN